MRSPETVRARPAARILQPSKHVHTLGDRARYWPGPAPDGCRERDRDRRRGSGPSVHATAVQSSAGSLDRTSFATVSARVWHDSHRGLSYTCGLSPGGSTVTRGARLDLAMNAITAVLCFGILSLWVPARWALAVYQCGLFGLGAVWAAQFALRPFSLRLSGELALLAAVAVYGYFQLSAGITIYRWQTSETVLNWSANWLLFFFVLQFSTA